MKLFRLLTVLVAASLTATFYAQSTTAPISDADKAFLTKYEAVRAALAADDLDRAKKAAAQIADSQPAATLDAAKVIAKADSLQAAREGFKTLSKRAVHVAANQPGYHKANCPMVANNEGDWVQTTNVISNPYMGKKMPNCGSVAGESHH
jgi:hypothetical protein